MRRDGNVAFVAFCLVLIALPVRAATKVFLLGGQSNMAGVGGYDSPLPAPYNVPQPAVKFWNKCNPTTGWPPADPGDAWVDLQGGFGHQYYSGMSLFGPEVSLGYRLDQLLPNDDIYLVKCGLSSTNLAVDWNPDGTGAVYNVFKVRVDAALKNLVDAGKSPSIAGMIWMQGENDAIDSTFAAAYQKNLRNLIGTVREEFSTPNMPFVMGRILTYYDTTPAGGNALVRAAQETVGTSMAGVTWINTDDLPLAYDGHYGTQGQIDIGIRFADKLARAPEPSSAILSAVILLAVAACRWWRQW